MHNFRRFRAWILVCCLISMLVSQQVQAQALPVAARVGVAVAGTIERQLIRRGLAANDPRFQATLNAVGIAANDAVFNVVGTAGMVVAGIAGAPVWATVAIGLGVGALAFGAYKLLTQPVSVVDPVTGQTVQRYALATGDATTADILAAANHPLPAPSSSVLSALKNPTPSQYTMPASEVFLMVQMRSPSTCAQYFECSSRPSGKTYPSYIPASSNGYAAIPVSTIGDFTAYVNFMIGQAVYTGDDSNPNAPARMGHAEGLSIALSAGKMVASGRIVYDWQWNGGADPDGNKTYEPRSDGYYSPINWNTLPNPYFVPPPDVGTLDELLAKLANNIGAANASISPQSLADITNAAWIKAASSANYQGYPYALTDPVTSADASAWQAANPLKSPTLNDALAPISGPVTVPNPTPTTTPDPSTNPTTETPTKVDLGPDPGIPQPALEATPTAQMILQPLLNLFPSLKNFVVPPHDSVCPKPSFAAFSKTFVIDAHCDLFESVRPTLYAVMAMAWVALALFIILAA